jgi:molybdate transport system ATP-binding protein
MLIRCRIPLATFDLDLDVHFEARVTCIFGPSGSGKTSLLDAIAGLRPISSGELEIGGRRLFSSSQGINLSPQERSIGYVPQEGALFPHLSVRDNILFGAGQRKSHVGDGQATLEHVAELLEITHLLGRPIAQLSGGESQRIALARAILSRPRLLLLDEPLASLEIRLKEKIIPYLRRVRDEFAIPILYVTHDPVEALALADWVIAIRQGKLVSQGMPREVLTSRSVFHDLEEESVENVFAVRVLGSDPIAGRSRTLLDSGQELIIPYVAGTADQAVQVRVRGDDILLAKKRPEGISAGNVLSGVINEIEALDGQAILKVDAGAIFSVRLTAGAVANLNLAKGEEVFLIFKVRSCTVL